MPKKIICSCQQGYHYSQASRAHCRNVNGLIKALNQSKQIHLNDCICHLCQNLIKSSIAFLQPRQQKLQKQQQQIKVNLNSSQPLDKQVIICEPNSIQIQLNQNQFASPTRERKKLILQQTNQKQNQLCDQLLSEQILPKNFVLEQIFVKQNKIDHRSKRQKQIRKLRNQRKKEKKERKNFYSCGFAAHQHRQLKYAKRCRSRRYIGYNVEQIVDIKTNDAELPAKQPIQLVLDVNQSLIDSNIEKYLQHLELLKKQNRQFSQKSQKIKSFQKCLNGKKQWVDFSKFSTGNDLFNSFQLRQTMFGDCSLMAICMALAKVDKKHIKKLFVIKQQNQQGYYVIKLFFKDEITYIQVDPFVFVQKQTKMSYIGYAKDSLWFTLLGKALIQLVGAPKYNNIYTQQVFQHLFGKLPLVIEVKKISCIITLFKAKKNQIVIIASKPKVKNHWIPQTHSFPIIQIDEKRIAISNTWGYFRHAKTKEIMQNLIWLQEKDLIDFDQMYQLDL